MKLKELRERQGLTQSQIAKLLGCAESTICHYERGERKVSVEVAIKLAKALGVSVEEVVACFEKKA